ncbi:unnamed protein product, partial [Closterium sp. NIES-54]
VPVLTPGGVGAAQLAAGGYGQPFIAAVDPSNPTAALYYAPASAAGQQAAVYAAGGSAPVDISASIASAAALWKPPQQQQLPSATVTEVLPGDQECHSSQQL